VLNPCYLTEIQDEPKKAEELNFGQTEKTVDLMTKIEKFLKN
jgi:hypothetical protein